MTNHITPELAVAALTLAEELQANHRDLLVSVKPDDSHGGTLLVHAHLTDTAISSRAAAYLATMSSSERADALDLARKGDGFTLVRCVERSPLTDARGHLIGSSTSTGFPLLVSHTTPSAAVVACVVARDLAA